MFNSFAESLSHHSGSATRRLYRFLGRWLFLQWPTSLFSLVLFANSCRLSVLHIFLNFLLLKLFLACSLGRNSKLLTWFSVRSRPPYFRFVIMLAFFSNILPVLLALDLLHTVYCIAPMGASLPFLSKRARLISLVLVCAFFVNSWRKFGSGTRMPSVGWKLNVGLSRGYVSCYQLWEEIFFFYTLTLTVMDMSVQPHVSRPLTDLLHYVIPMSWLT